MRSQATWTPPNCFQSLSDSALVITGHDFPLVNQRKFQEGIWKNQNELSSLLFQNENLVHSDFSICLLEIFFDSRGENHVQWSQAQNRIGTESNWEEFKWLDSSMLYRIKIKKTQISKLNCCSCKLCTQDFIFTEDEKADSMKRKCQ